MVIPINHGSQCADRKSNRRASGADYASDFVLQSSEHFHSSCKYFCVSLLSSMSCVNFTFFNSLWLFIVQYCGVLDEAVKLGHAPPIRSRGATNLASAPISQILRFSSHDQITIALRSRGKNEAFPPDHIKTKPLIKCYSIYIVLPDIQIHV